jgi:hypothetical protein
MSILAIVFPIKIFVYISIEPNSFGAQYCRAMVVFITCLVYGMDQRNSNPYEGKDFSLYYHAKTLISDHAPFAPKYTKFLFPC